MVKCVVVGCTSGYTSNKEKYHKFCAPKDLDLRKKWQMKIPRKNFILTEKSYVCEKHFKEDDIVKFWESGTIKVRILNIMPTDYDLRYTLYLKQCYKL